RAPALVVRPEHEVVDEQLRAAVEQLGQRSRALLGLEAVLLLDRHPGELASLPSKLVAAPGVLLLLGEQLVPSRATRRASQPSGPASASPQSFSVGYILLAKWLTIPSLRSRIRLAARSSSGSAAGPPRWARRAAASTFPSPPSPGT